MTPDDEYAWDDVVYLAVRDCVGVVRGTLYGDRATAYVIELADGGVVTVTCSGVESIWGRRRTPRSDATAVDATSTG